MTDIKITDSAVEGYRIEIEGSDIVNIDGPKEHADLRAAVKEWQEARAACIKDSFKSWDRLARAESTLAAIHPDMVRL